MVCMLPFAEGKKNSVRIKKIESDLAELQAKGTRTPPASSEASGTYSPSVLLGLACQMEMTRIKSSAGDRINSGCKWST